jgi:hypothetical protein
MSDPVLLAVPANRARWSDLVTLFQRGVVVPLADPRSVTDFLTADLGLGPDYVQRMIATVLVDSMVVDDLDLAQLRPGSTLTLSAAMPGLVGATLRRSGYYAAMRAEVNWRASDRDDADRGDRDRAHTITVKLFNLIILGVAPAILRRGIVLTHADAVGVLGPDTALQRIPGDREILLQVGA